MEILVEIDFDSGTRRYSRLGIRTATRSYSPRVMAFGGIAREIGLVPGDYRASTVSVTLSNVSGEFTQLRTSEPWRNRPLRILVVDPDRGLGSMYTAFEGRIETWTNTATETSITAVDWIQSRLQRPLLGLIDSEFYPNLPDETPRALIPIVIGEVSSPGGAVPAYLVDPDIGVTGWRYVMAQGRVPEPDAVYVDGALADPDFDYAINYDEGPGGIECTYIDFDEDKGTAAVSWNGSGITEDGTETGDAITNGAEQLARFLRLNGFASNDLDLNTITAAAEALSDAEITGAFVAVDRELNVGGVVTQFAESYNLQIFATRGGKVGMSAPSTLVSGGDVPEVTALKDVVRGSFSAAGAGEVAATLVAPYKRNFFTGELESQHTETNLRQVNDLFEDVVLLREFPFIRDATSIAAVVGVKMFFLREQRQRVRVLAPPRWYEDLDIGRQIKLTHFAGIGPSGETEENHRTEDLVALYRLDENDGQVIGDTSGQDNHGELGTTSGVDSEDPEWVPEGLLFDGEDDYATAPFLVDPDASDFTAFVIFRASAAGNRRVLLYQQDGTGQGRVWLEINADNKLATHIGGNVNAHGETLVAGEWYAATVRLFEGTVSLFLEGGDKEDFIETAEASDGDMLIGSAPAVPGEGLINDNLVAFYRFDEGSGDTLNDHSGNANHAQLGTSAGADANDPDWVAEGLDFPNADDQVITPSLGISPNTDDVTAFAAVKVSSDAVLRLIIQQADGTGIGQSWLRVTSAHRLETRIGNATHTHTTVLTTDAWYVVAVRKSGTAISLFVDGGSKQDFMGTALAANGGLFIGNHNLSNQFPFLDTIALIAVHNDNLTDQQVADQSAALREILDARLGSPDPAPAFDDRIALIAAYDAAMSDTAVEANTVELKRIVNSKLTPSGFYQVLGSKLVSAGRSLAAELSLVDLAQEPLLTLLSPQQPESFLLSDGKSDVVLSATCTLLGKTSIAGASVVTINGRQNYVTDGLTNLWLFNQGSGQQLTDYIGGAHGQLGTSSGSDSADPSWVTEGLSFDGSNDVVQIPNWFNPATGDWHLMFVFQSQHGPSFPPAVIMSGLGVTNQKPYFVHHLDNDLYTEAFVATGVGGTITPGTWYMGYMKRTTNPSRLVLGIRRTGSNQSSTFNSPTMQNVSGGNVFLGRGLTGFEFPWPGKIAWMAHFNKALSDAEFTKMFDAAKGTLAGRGINL